MDNHRELFNQLIVMEDILQKCVRGIIPIHHKDICVIHVIHRDNFTMELIVKIVRLHVKDVGSIKKVHNVCHVIMLKDWSCHNIFQNQI